MKGTVSKWALVMLNLLLVASVSITVYTFYNFENTKKSLLNSFMLQPLKSIEHQLYAFFRPSTQLIAMAATQGSAALFDIRDTASVNRYFMPLLANYDQITSIGVADTSGYEYDILLTDSAWRTRTVRPQVNDGSNFWGHWSMDMDSCIGKWSEPMRQDPRQRPWYLGAMEEAGHNHWTGPYMFNTDSVHGITLSRTMSYKDGQAIVALDITLNRLYDFMSNVGVGKQGGAFLLTKNLEPISLSEQYATDSFAMAARSITESLRNKQDDGPIATELGVKVGKELWNARILRFSLDDVNHLYAVVAVPEEEMMASVNRASKVVYLGMVITTCFTGLMLMLIWQLRKVNRKLENSSEKLTAQSQVIARRNKDMQDSLNYAQGIQSIMLPQLEEVSNRSIQNTMVIYQPKDTVSGDFYWVRHRNNISYIAVADCTGHGVPGAMMSILGMDLLNAIVGIDVSSLPEKLLYQLRKVMIKRMRSGDNIAKDGMDLGLCRLDHTTKMLNYAGAFTPLVLIRNKEAGDFLELTTNGRHVEMLPTQSSDSHHLYQIKGDRMPLGYLEHVSDGPFTGHGIQLLPTDSVYMMSDGYADQFGGIPDRKFGQRRLMKTLLDIEPFTMTERKEKLLSVLNTYKGNNEQIDDICVLVFRCSDLSET